MNPVDRLLAVMAQLRDPDNGCPWDLEQDFSTIAPHTVEEAYEVADAIERNDLVALRDELGDLLFQVVFHARLAEEQGAFRFNDVVNGLCDKMERRHPHVFADGSIEDADAQTVAWEAQKASERHASKTGVLDSVPRALPALRRAAKLGKRAASVGFDWPAIDGVRRKVDEELGELDREIASGDRTRIEAELGDLMFALVNLGRHAGIDAETALQGANNRFRRRFRHMERALAAAGQIPEQVTPAELERLWEAAKAAESAG